MWLVGISRQFCFDGGSKEGVDTLVARLGCIPWGEDLGELFGY